MSSRARGVGRAEPLWRRYHRWVGLVVSLFFLLIAGSGVWLQFAPNRMDEIYAGRLDDAAVRAGFARALRAAHAERPGAAIDSVLINISGPSPIGTVSLRQPGAPAAGPGGGASVVVDLRDGRVLPPLSSLHGTLVSLHNSFLLGTAGRLIDLGCAAGLLFLCLSGLYVYTVMWRRQRGPAVFWRSPSTRLAAVARDVHRWLTVLALLFLCVLAVTGAWMQLSSVGLFGGSPQSASIGGLDRAKAAALPDLTDAQLQAALDHGLAESNRIDPKGRLFMILSTASGPAAFTSLTYASDKEGMYSHSFDSRTGAVLPPPTSNFFFLLRLHRGDLFGSTGTWVNILTGTALILLAVSGLYTYYDMYLRRRRGSGSRRLFW